MGRTGKWWSFQHYNIKPDIMTTAKALQVGAVVSTKEYDPHDPGAVSSTWGGGHRIDMAIGLRTIEIIEKEKLLKNAQNMGNYFMKWLNELKERYSDKITDVRGLGLMIGVEFSDAKYRDRIVQEAFKNGLLLLGCGFNVLRIAPPLNITKVEVDHGLSIIDGLLKT
jgi:4-aminobutyrate aminotransferase